MSVRAPKTYDLILTKEQVQHYNAWRPEVSRDTILCHAPMKSMYIGNRGRVFLCCFNKQFDLGIWPESKLHDIWFSQDREHLKKTLEDHDFSLGCHGCYYNLQAGHYAGLPAKNFDKLPLDEEQYPVKIDFELSNICNLECIMCRGELSSSIRKNRENKPPLISPYDERFVDQLEEFIPHLKHSHFLGGEPFLIPIYFPIWEKMYELNPELEISVQTNATVLNERVKSLLEKVPISISVSIDGMTADTYESIRINAKFDRVIENIHWFADYCKRKGTDMNISFCPMQQNWKEVPMIVDFCNELDIQLFYNSVFFPYECSPMSLRSEKLEEIIVFLERFDFPKSDRIKTWNANSYSSMLSQMRYWKDEAAKSENLFRKQRHEIASLDEFYDRLSKYIKHHHTPEETEALYRNVRGKAQYILDAADRDGDFKPALDTLILMDPGILCKTLPNVSEEQIYRMFKETFL